MQNLFDTAKNNRFLQFMHFPMWIWIYETKSVN